ncbi:MATE family efflux transporter [Flavobacterium sp. '19STA2R22 D10 B1']|uniref:MATE family efflux transporter n=1 Tax=Flavobacterium aerium TaxID=3037261 RepID=UPI00278BFD08|nr:MATE family efflux transporter [Flavobacterium sp. '19STA2R22 D10 B1']
MKTEAKKTIRLAFPIIVGELAQMALHLIDSAMVGAISYKQLAASALVFNTLHIPFVFGIGITISVSQMVSMAHGQRDGQRVSHFFFNGFFLCALIAVIISGALFFGSDILFHLGQDPEVATLAVPFMKMMAISIVPMLFFMTLKQFTDGLEFTKIAMILSLVGLPVNVFLNWLLIYGNLGFPRLELMGAGLGTLITRSLLFITLGIIIFRHGYFKRYIAVRKKQWKIKLNTIKELLHIGIPSSFQLGMEAGAFAVSGILVGTIGAIEQAAHSIAISCVAFMFMFSMGLEQAGSIRVSNAFGRSKWDKIAVIGKSTLLIALAYGVLCALILILFNKSLPLLFNSNVEVVKVAGTLLFLAAIFQISDSTQATAAGLLRGIKDVKIPTYLIAIAFWVIGLPVGYVLAFNFKMGPAGIWIGFIVGLTSMSVFLTSRFFRMVNRNIVKK